ncbi:MAG: hypothetical protein NT014_01320 [Candidatus Omnitrophica bacterium]|nr:hypothetical protein [Candidatus Omnitrophota bacterium]
MLRCQKAQAILELAILGSIIILAFSFAIKYSERGNREQSYMQQTFRALLKKAKLNNSTASWQTMDFRRMPNVVNPMELGELEQFSSSNSIIWSDDLEEIETKSKSYFQLNRGPEQEIASGSAGLPGTGESMTTSFTSNAAGTTTSQKNEQGGRIVTNKSLNATDSISGSADLGGTTVSLGGSLGEGGKYTGGGINRSRSMQ